MVLFHLTFNPYKNLLAKKLSYEVDFFYNQQIFQLIGSSENYF